MTFPDLVRAELLAARTEHDPVYSHHHYHGVIMEELQEAREEIAKPPRLRCNSDICAEIVQIGSMCQRWAEDMTLVYGDNFTLKVTLAVRRSRDEYPPIPSHHHYASWLQAALWDAFHEIRIKPQYQCRERICEALVRAAVRAQRWAEDMDLVDKGDA